jgi:organic radical activating enzyme
MKAPKLSTADEARIVEVFSSIQGEGLRLGDHQVFVRFGGCNLHCDYCDEPDTIPIPSGEVWSAERLKRRVLALQRKRRHEAVSWTGGEPLLHPAFLKELMPWARAKGLKNYLETNGTRVEAFRALAPLCDWVAMDLKLPSATGRETWSEHLEFLRVAPEKTFAKVVLTSKTTQSEWRQVIRLMQEVSTNVPLILQPATEREGIASIEPAAAVQLMRQAAALLKDVRLIPQWHPVWGLA